MSEEQLSIELMRNERKTYESIYAQFVLSTKKFESYAFCFYEGEDGKYYDLRIRQKFSDKFITYIAGNKDAVLKLLKKIKSTNMYDNVCMMFFVDRDFDDNRGGGESKDLYVTPCYSIENLYVEENCFHQILQSEFGLNITDIDYEKCLTDFRLREIEFNEKMLEFNSLVLLRRKKYQSNSIYSIGSVKTAHLVQVTLENVNYSQKYNDTINDIKNGLHVDEEELEQAKEKLREQGDFSKNFRGKNQLDFFVSLINDLKERNRNGGYFSKKYNNIHINLTSNRLSELSQYATTPLSLDVFLQEHRDMLSR